MLNTYLNDNQNMPYPFYGFGSLPFPMSCITGLGICIKGKSPAADATALYASSVSIATDSVMLAICRKTAAGFGSELVGMIYANTLGYYAYIPSYINDAVYEDQTITPHKLRRVFSDYAPDMIDTTTEQHPDDDQFEWTDHTHEVVLDDIIQDMQVFYSYIKENVTATLGEITSSGYMQLGTIPESAIGVYTGEFYLDPSVVTYMPDEVYGVVQSYRINEDVYPMGQSFGLEATGSLQLLIHGNTVSLATYGTDVDSLAFTEIPYSNKTRVTSVNGHVIKGTAEEDNVYPSLDFRGDAAHGISWDGVLVSGGTTTDTVLLTLTGGTALDCYARGGL